MVDSRAGRDSVVKAAEVLDPIIAPLGLAFKQVIGAFERETGMSAPQWFILNMLDQGDGVSQGEVCQRFQLDPSRITRLAQALEGEGMIRRERDPEDNRVVRMYLTDRGRELIRGVAEKRERFELRIRSRMDEEELQELRRLLDALTKAARE
jgi:DNA-binding MarR family transcriptional regulator